jgi:spore germination cell wall hydrolase CwlJ-like protein
MTPKFFSGMSKQKVESLLVKGTLVLLTFFVFATAFANGKQNRAYLNSMTPITDWVTGQLQGYENETWEQRVRRLMTNNLEEAGGMRKALSDKQVRCLAENIYYESRGESLEGQVAVAKVTLNRLDEGYANTVCGVVKQRSEAVCQFSWVCNGNSNPAGFLWNQAVGLAVVLINVPEAIEDPTNGATHFHATYINWQPGWKQMKDSVNRIGNHIFYRVKPKEEK